MLDLPNQYRLLAHPQVGASWEGFVLEQVLQVIKPTQAYFWATYSGADLDLFLLHQGFRFGIEVKFSETPRSTRSMRNSIEDLALHHLWIIYPGQHAYPIDDRLSVYPLQAVTHLSDQIDKFGVKSIGPAKRKAKV